MILSSKDTQFKLAEDGQIFWQKEVSNPLPGVRIGHVTKGDALTLPKAEIDISDETGEAKEDVRVFVQGWLDRHIKTVLTPLFKLKESETVPENPKALLEKLFTALGILPREDLQSLISTFDEEQRKALRGFKIRMGPLLVFLPELNKPAAVRLRALLLTLWQGKDLPAQVPTDGIVSFSIEDRDIDKDYYRSIGYPVYGPRAIRVDMLDRVVCAVYDAAKEGQFQAQHQMAEWLGSNIADLYKVLEAMGHVKTHDPLEEQIAEKLKAEEAKAEEENPAENKPQEEKAEPQAAENKPQEKPELATFRLKRGKAIHTETAKSKPNFKTKPKEKPAVKRVKPKGKPGEDRNKERVYKAEAKINPEDSPFAVLQQLKDAAKK
ncbi:MAG: hypothetical protein H6853_08860 [Rhodospirillales bacterium]|nr:hypothetical protein [Alphaproteobacteria bacterium]USO03615.1 MAG: hypothetical protein H6853_08860 [Rhodospirillales bacterium]